MDRFDWLELDSVPSTAEVTAAAPQAEAVVRTMPTDGSSFHKAAREMRAAGHFKAASDFYRKSLGYDDKNYAAWAELIDTLVRGQRLDEADAVSTDAHTNFKKVRVLYSARALVLAHQGSVDDALPLAQVGIEGGEGLWYPRCVMGELLLLMDKGNRTTSAELFDEAVDLSRERWEPYWLAGWALLDARLPALAASYFAEAAHQNPRAPICWLCLGDCFRELKLYDQALFYYQRVTEIEPTNELGLKREKECSISRFNVLGAFKRSMLERRWKDKFNEAVKKQEKIE